MTTQDADEYWPTDVIDLELAQDIAQLHTACPESASNPSDLPPERERVFAELALADDESFIDDEEEYEAELAKLMSREKIHHARTTEVIEELHKLTGIRGGIREHVRYIIRCRYPTIKNDLMSGE